MAVSDVTADTTIAARFRAVAAAAPDTLALTAPRARYTYAELDRWSDAIAAAVIAAAAPVARAVAIVTRDHIALVAAALGVVKAGHFFVVIDAGDPDERIATILTASDAALAVVDAPEIAPNAVRALPLVALVGTSGRAVRPPECRPNELVQLVFTSGTTGAPKAIANRQRAFVERLVAASAVTGRAAGERVSYTALPGFARATYEIFGSLLNGATLCAFDARTESLDALGNFIAREQISVLTLTPSLFRRLMLTAPAGVDLSSVKKLRIGADVVTVADVEAYKARFPRTCTLERGFNASETGMVLHLRITHDTPVPGPLVPVGRPRPGVDVRLIDEEGRDVTDGETGELVVRSASVVDGYWNAPGLTAQKFAQDPEHPELRTFFTGDLLRRDADGLYYFIGRKDSRLKIHGRRIDPLEVESALVASAGVREAVALGKRGADGELRLVAYVVMPPGGTCVPREIRAALRHVVPAWMVPARIYALDAMPVTGAGKVDREALAQRVELHLPDAGVVSSDALERTLLAIWSRVIGTTVGRDDDFFDDLGGESIVAAHLVTEVHRAIGQSLPLSLLIELNTVAKMADYLRAQPALEQTAILLQRGGSLPPLFCVSGKLGSVMIFRELAALLGPEQPFYGLTHHGFSADAFPKTLATLAACYAATIRRIQPEGPYYLAGYSAGGVVAYETARQMTAAGERVAFVGMIDTALRAQPSAQWKRYAKHFALLRHRPWKNGPRYARAVGRRVVTLLCWLARIPAPRPEPLPYIATNHALTTIRRGATIGPYSGPVTLFLARHGWGTDATNPDLGWRALCGDLRILRVAGEHQSVIREDVASLAEAFVRTMAEARAKSSRA